MPCLRFQYELVGDDDLKFVCVQYWLIPSHQTDTESRVDDILPVSPDVGKMVRGWSLLQ
jgi:hypothetical protein